MNINKLITLLLLISFCGGSAEPVSIPVEEDFISTTTQFNGVTTTTIKIEETTTTTANIITEEIISDIKLEILNCPSEKVEIAIGESYKVEF